VPACCRQSASQFSRRELGAAGKSLGSRVREREREREGRMPHLRRVCPVLHLLCARSAISQEAQSTALMLMLVVLLVVLLKMKMVGLEVSWSVQNNVRSPGQKTERVRP